MTRNALIIADGRDNQPSRLAVSHSLTFHLTPVLTTHFHSQAPSPVLPLSPHSESHVPTIIPVPFHPRFSLFSQWLSRVREALSFSAELHANKQANRRKQQQRKAGDAKGEKGKEGEKVDKGDKIEEGDEEDDDDTTADALSELRDLLKESDEMPVYMEEAVLLKCQLQALEWANKAALILPLTASLASSSTELDDPSEQERPVEESDPRDGDAPQSASYSFYNRPRPRLAEVQRLAKEIKK